MAICASMHCRLYSCELTLISDKVIYYSEKRVSPQKAYKACRGKMAAMALLKLFIDGNGRRHNLDATLRP